MAIRKDAGIILNVLYNKRVQNRDERISSSKIIEESEWGGNRVLDALEYMEEKNLIHVGFKSSDGGWELITIIAEGIDLVENNDKFQKHFEMGVNLGLLSFRWGTKER